MDIAFKEDGVISSRGDEVGTYKAGDKVHILDAIRNNLFKIIVLEGESKGTIMYVDNHLLTTTPTLPTAPRDDYRYVYDNWYMRSCLQSNETPVPFEIYRARMPQDILKQLVTWLDEGRRP